MQLVLAVVQVIPQERIYPVDFPVEQLVDLAVPQVTELDGVVLLIHPKFVDVPMPQVAALDEVARLIPPEPRRHVRAAGRGAW